jgi:hypothetical protein
MRDLAERSQEKHRGMRRSRRPLALLVAGCSAVIMLATFLVPMNAAVASPRGQTIRAATSPTGTVSGTVTITGAPKNFSPALVAVGGCTSGSFAACSSPQFAEASTSYTITLPEGTWHLQAFYVLVPYGGAFIGSTSTVTVKANETTEANLTVAYKKPGSVKGTVTVTKIPSGVSVSQKVAVACPSDAPNPNAAAADLVCAESGDSGTYSMTSLSPGSWIIYPGYETKFGATIATKGTSVTVTSGTIKTVDLTTPYLAPTSGLVSGKATVTSAPAGFDDEVGVLACKGSTVSLTCASLQEYPVSGNSYELPLTAGTWTLEMIYFLEPYGGLQIGSSKTVTVLAGKTVTVPLTDAYATPGTARGTISVTGAPEKVSILSYSILACPAGSPYDGNSFDPQCAGESSGAGITSFAGQLGAHFKMSPDPLYRAVASSSSQEPYSLPLPAGKWLLYPSYTTEFGTALNAKGTLVTVKANATSTTNLTLAYQAPTGGVVTGTTELLDAPSDFSGVYGVEACPSPASTSPDDVCSVNSTQIGPTGDYDLAVPTGTWWVAELYNYDIPQGGDSSEIVPVAGPSHKLVVNAATSYVLNLSATYRS